MSPYPLPRRAPMLPSRYGAAVATVSGNHGPNAEPGGLPAPPAAAVPGGCSPAQAQGWFVTREGLGDTGTVLRPRQEWPRARSASVQLHSPCRPPPAQGVQQQLGDWE